MRHFTVKITSVYLLACWATTVDFMLILSSAASFARIVGC